MRKTRVLAVLLCIMMVATTIPMITATAIENGATKTETVLMTGYESTPVGGRNFSSADDLGTQKRTMIANFTTSAGTQTEFSTLYPVTLTEETPTSEDSDGKYLKYIGHNVEAGHPDWSAAASSGRTAEVNTEAGTADSLKWQYSSDAYGSYLLKYRFRLTGTGAAIIKTRSNAEYIIQIKNNATFSKETGVSVSTGVEGTWHEVIVIVTNPAADSKNVEFWYSNNNSDTYQYAGTQIISKNTGYSKSQLSFLVDAGTTMELDHILMYGLASETPDPEPEPEPDPDPDDEGLTEAEMYAEYPYVMAKQDYDNSYPAFTQPTNARADYANVSLVTAAGASERVLKFVGHNVKGTDYEWVQSNIAQEEAQLNLTEAVIDYGSPAGFSAESMIGIRFKVEGEGATKIELKNADQINLTVQRGESFSAVCGTGVYGRATLTVADDAWYEIVIDVYENAEDGKTWGDFYYRKADGKFYLFGSKVIDPSNGAAKNQLTLQANSGPTLYLDSITLRSKTEPEVDPEPDPTPDPTPDPDPNPTPGDEGVAAEELYTDYHFVAAKQDYPTNYKPTLAADRADSSKVTSATIDGATVLKIVGHNYTFNDLNQRAEILLGEPAIVFGCPDGVSAETMTVFRFKLDGTGSARLELRNTDQISLDVKNGQNLSVDGGAYAVSMGNGWHEIAVIAYEEADTTKGEFWYRSNDGNFRYFGKKSINSSTNTKRLSIKVDVGTTLYLDAITTRVKNKMVTDAAAIVASKGTVVGLGITADATGKKLNTAGKMTIGTADSENVRRATVISAGYHKDYGYTTFVNTKTYSKIYTGMEVDLSNQIDVSTLSVDEQTTLLTQDTLGIMVWDTLHHDATGTGIPLCSPVYTGAAGIPANVATGAPESLDKGLTVASKYNAVQLAGFVGKGETVTAMILSGDSIKAIGQATANENGMMDLSIGIDPFKNNGGSYTLWYQYGKEVPVSKIVTLYCVNDLSGSNITDVTSFINFINDFGNDAEKEDIGKNGFAQEAFERFIALGGMGSSETFDFFGFPTRVSQAMAEEAAERALIAKINSASDWGTMKKLVVDTYGSLLGISETDYSDIQSPDGIFRRMIGGNYIDVATVKSGFESAYAAQKLAETSSGTVNTPSGGGGGFGGGAGGVGGNQYHGAGVSGGGAVSGGGMDEATPVGTISGGGVKVFNDLDSVSWAEESILELQKAGIVSGDEDGNFRPNDSITREEYLKILMLALDIPMTGEAGHFTDVKVEDWYYSYVAGAYASGIVQGISGEEFGIGRKITRADMAVMLLRALKYKGIVPKPEKAAFVFSDFDEMPQYATESISVLAEANLMNGVGNNCFAPAANTTRAEAAVATQRIIEYIRKGV